MAKVFIDTNVLVYANDERDDPKRGTALRHLAGLASTGAGVISTQCLVEYAAVALRKLFQPPEAIDSQLAFFVETFQLIQVDPPIIRRAVGLAPLHQISYFDALMLAAAESAGCTEILSEDLSAGQSYAGVTAVNPFHP